MDFSLREWLIVVGVIVIVGVLIDGYRRVRSGSRGRIKMSIDKKQTLTDNDRVDYFNGELPRGGARVVTRSGDVAAEASSDRTEPPIPAFDVAHELRPDPLFADDYEPTISEPDDGISADNDFATAHESAQFSEAEVVANEEPVEEFIPEPELEPEIKVEPERKPERKVERKPERKAERKPVVEPEPEPQKAAFQQVEEVIVINVFSKDDSGFNGANLMRVILACGMRYGDMDIFHREEDGADAAIQFSMANLVKPGTFDLNAMDHFSTPGVSFFLSLPGPKNSMKAFDYMYETALCVVKNLNGELKDEMHSTMTSQTIEHSRQKVRDFERRQLSQMR